MIHPFQNRVLLRAWRPDWRHYGVGSLRLDLLAGLTVAIFAIPQVMAYAVLAGLPPAYGLYTAIVMSITAALFCHSGLLNTGPTNSAALLTAAVAVPLASHPDLFSVVFTLALLVGIFRLLMGLLRMGALVRFVPEPAFLGFMVGAGVLIAFGQLHHLFGVDASTHRWFIRRFTDVIIQTPDLHVATFIVGLGAFGLMVALNRYARRLPAALIVILSATAIVFVLGEDSGVALVQDIAPLTRTLPAPAFPGIARAEIPALIPLALAISVIGLIEAAVVGQYLALRTGRHVNFNQDFFGQGVSQIVAAFFQCFPGSGSFVRSTLLAQCGARSRMANIAFGLHTALLIVLIPGLLNRIPVTALAGLLLFLGTRLIDPSRIRQVRATSRADLFVLVLTFAVTVFGRIEYGIFAGILASMIIFLNRACELHMVELIPLPGGGFEERPYAPLTRHDKSDVVAMSVSGNLFFGVAHELRAQLNEIAREQQPRHLLLRLRRAHSIDSSCWSALFDFARAFDRNGGTLYLCGIQPQSTRVITEARMREILPKNRIYLQTNAIFGALLKALEDIGPHISDDTELSDEWRNFFHRLKKNRAR